MCTSCTDDGREKVPSFQKVTLFYDINTQNPYQLTFLFVTGYRDIRRIKLNFFVSIGLVVFATQQHKKTTISRLIIEIQL